MLHWQRHLRSPLSPDEVRERLAACVLAPEQSQNGLTARVGDGREYAFVGHVEESGFVLDSMDPFHNQKRAQFQGTVQSTAGGSLIRLRYRLPRFTLAMTAVVVAMSLFWPLQDQAWGALPGWERVVFAVVFAGLVLGGYLQGAVSTRRRLMALLQAVPTRAPHPRTPTVSR